MIQIYRKPHTAIWLNAEELSATPLTESSSLKDKCHGAMRNSFN